MLCLWPKLGLSNSCFIVVKCLICLSVSLQQLISCAVSSAVLQLNSGNYEESLSELLTQQPFIVCFCSVSSLCYYVSVQPKIKIPLMKQGIGLFLIFLFIFWFADGSRLLQFLVFRIIHLIMNLFTPSAYQDGRRFMLY